MYTYEVEVYTGVESTCEMNGSVHITLVGEQGDTGKRTLLRPVSSTSRQKFCPEQVACSVKSSSFAGILLDELYKDCVRYSTFFAYKSVLSLFSRHRWIVIVHSILLCTLRAVCRFLFVHSIMLFNQPRNFIVDLSSYFLAKFLDDVFF